MDTKTDTTELLTATEIEICRTIGRDEEGRRMTIGLAELDAQACRGAQGVKLREAIKSLAKELEAESEAAQREQFRTGREYWTGEKKAHRQAAQRVRAILKVQP